MRSLGRDVGKIGAGDDRSHSGQCPRLFSIDRYDPGVSMRTALDPAPQHTRHRHVGTEIGPARDLVDAVGADRPGADYLKRGLVEIAHLHPPSSHGVLETAARVLGTSARPRTSRLQGSIVCPKVASSQKAWAEAKPRKTPGAT